MVSRDELNVGEVKGERELMALRQVISLLDKVDKKEVSCSFFHL